jgi:glycosyltransferase involved in cell wall biosynthesis
MPTVGSRKPPYPVLHVLGTAAWTATAHARIVLPLAERLDPARFRLHAWFLGGGGSLTDEFKCAGIRVRVLPWAGVRDPVGAARFWQALRKEEFAILHQHYGGRSVRWLARRASRASIVLHLHQRVSEAQSLEPRPIRVADTDIVIANSNAVAGLVVNKQARVVYPGVAAPDQPQSARLTSATPPVIGAAGRLAPIKGFAHLIRALGLLREAMPDVRLEIAGTGPAQGSLKQEARVAGVDDRVSFLGWQADLLSCFARWDVFVQPSLEEAFGLAALEAMAAGLPVVATAVGGLLELIEDGRTGWLVPPADPQALAKRLRELLRDREQRRTLGAAGQARARQNFSVERMVSSIERTYVELLSSYSRD